MRSRAETEKVKESILEEIRQGAVSLGDAGRRAGVPRTTLFKWPKLYPDWRRQVEALLRSQAIVPNGEFPNFPEFRRRFFKRESFWYHLDAYNHIEEEDRLLVLVAPSHAKTMVWSIEYSAYRIFRSAATDPKRGVRILVIQKSEEQSRKVVSAVQTRLTSHEFYEQLGIPEEEDPITLYGGGVGFRPPRQSSTPWATDYFTIAGAVSGEKDYTMEAKGVQGSIVGNRVDLAIIDDPQDPKTTAPHTIDEMVRWTNQAVLSRVPRKVIALGSRIGPEDYWSRMLEEEWAEDWPRVMYPAILPCKRHGDEEMTEDCPHMEQRLLCPDLYGWGKDSKRIELPDGRLNMRKARKEAGRYWGPTWMQDEGSFADAIFNKEAMQVCCDDDRLLGDRPREVTHVVVGVDPATVNYCAMVVWGVDVRTKTRYLIDITNRKGMRTSRNVLVEAARLARTYRANTMVVEGNNTQKGWMIEDDWFRREMAGIGCPIVVYQTVTTAGARAESDDFDRSKVASLFDASLVVLPYGDIASQEVVDAYIQQCVAYRPGAKHQTKDMVDATLFAESRAREFARIDHEHKPMRSKAPAWVQRRHRARTEAEELEKERRLARERRAS